MLASALQAAALKEPEAPGSRRPSFKMPVNDNSLEHEEMPSPDHIIQSALIVDEERRNKRRGSQLLVKTMLSDEMVSAYKIHFFLISGPTSLLYGTTRMPEICRFTSAQRLKILKLLDDKHLLMAKLSK